MRGLPLLRDQPRSGGAPSEFPATLVSSLLLVINEVERLGNRLIARARPRMAREGSRKSGKACSKVLGPGANLPTTPTLRPLTRPAFPRQTKTDSPLFFFLTVTPYTNPRSRPILATPLPPDPR